MNKLHFSIPLFLLILLPSSFFGQESLISLNNYYYSPIASGVSYQNYSPISSLNTDYNIFELSANIRVPLPSMPLLQPFFQLGVITFDSLDSLLPDKWDHTDLFVALGIGLNHRFVKNFEVGADLYIGISESIFPDLVDSGTVGTQNFITSLSGKIGLIPSYNLSIEIKPSLMYTHNLGLFEEFNGFMYGIGFAVTYRFGDDPDSPASLIRSLKFNTIKINNLFSAMQSYYVHHPIGVVDITNVEKYPITDLNISFLQPGYMDSPTLSPVIQSLAPGESIEVELFATFNGEVFQTLGITPLIGEVIISYSSRGRPSEQRQSVSYDLYDKTALTWDDDRKVAAFITPADSALQNYTGFIHQQTKDVSLSGFNEELQFAMSVYNSLSETGIIYQIDPTSPFTEVQGNTILVDSISLPRDTLLRSTGDCDDLTVLFNSLMEAAGYETGFITVPGHIYSVVNTGISGRKYANIHPDRGFTINIDNELWIPIEITMIGNRDFHSAWRLGSELWNTFSDKRGFYKTREALKEYRSVGLKETDLGLQYGNGQNIAKSLEKDLDTLTDLIISSLNESARKNSDFGSYITLGLNSARMNRYGEAESAFRKALQINPESVSARNNLANIAYLNKDYRTSLDIYNFIYNSLKEKGRENSPVAQKILINISKTYHSMENFQKADDYYNNAVAIDSEAVQEFSYLNSVGADIGRAADISNSENEILFLEDE